VWVEALIDCPGAQGLYVYQLPPRLSVQPGDILSVPFGAQQTGAIAIRLIEQLPAELEPAKVRSIEDVITRRFFPPHYWTLLQQTADYYYTPLMQVIRTALPPGILGRSQRRIRLKSGVPDASQESLPPAAQALLACLQAQKTGDYAWHYLQRQVRGAQRGLTDLLQRGWVESYLEPPTFVRPKLRQVATLVNPPCDVELSLRQREILEVLKRRGGEMGVQELLQTCHASSSTLKRLEQKGCIVIQQQEILRAESGPMPNPDQPRSLMPAQQAAVEAIAALQGFTTVLLHGVTGSGKTEVYLQAIAPILLKGRSVLVLVPEIGLTPQLTDRFRARFGGKVQVYHSALSDGERYDTWRQMLGGVPQIIIGTRSAIFAPLPHLGLIVLDEEHDASFKQDQPAPCYHARTVACWRAQLENCPLILGSATPSLETWLAVSSSSPLLMQAIIPLAEQVPSPVNPPTSSLPSLAWVADPACYLTLPTRIQSRPLPQIEVVDMRQELHQGNRSIFSRSLQSALQQLKAQAQQGVLFIHRRGHSTFVSCRSCGSVLQCPHCDISLTYHQPHEGSVPTLRCHYCGYQRSHPQHCPTCDSPYLKHFGSGTQRVMQELAQHFPELRCIRFDSDTTRTKGAHRVLLTRFAQGEADLLVGTQMLTKGIDLPQVTLVGIVAADGLLYLADYRANERTLQTLMQVAGRAGRGDEPGRVILQTYSPQHPVIHAVQHHQYEAFMQTEQQQRATLYYPPYGQLILLRLSSFDPALVQQTAHQLADRLRPVDSAIAGYELLGPVPAVIVRVARRYRWQILLKCLPTGKPNLPDLTGLRSLCPTGVSLTIDVDPMQMT
jgi:primosomal protein N' (replication factor Y)